LSGFIIHKTTPGFAPLEQSLERLRFVEWTQTRTISAGSFKMGVSWPGDLYTPVYTDPRAGVTAVMLGRVYGPDDVRIDLNFPRLVTEYKERGAGALAEFNGLGALALLDYGLDTCFIATGRMGFFPMHIAFEDDPERVAVGSHADILAACYRKPLDLDQATMAEFLSAGSCTPPYTYYKSIRKLGSASLYRWNSEGFRKETTYWKYEPRPEYDTTVDAFAERMADAVRGAANMRLNSVGGKTGLFLSGGLDSRALLFSPERPGDKFTAITFCDSINRETRYARMLAQQANATHEILKREPEFYGRGAINAVRICSGMWSFDQAHTIGFTEDIHRISPAQTLSGLYFDYLFKGMAIDTRAVRTSRFKEPHREPAPLKHAWYHGCNYSIDKSPLGKAVSQRMEQLYDGLETENMTDEDRILIEARRLDPVSNGPGAGFAKILLRTVPFDIVTPDNRLLELVQRIPVNIKIGDQLFPKMLKHISPLALRVPDANTALPILDNEFAKFARFMWGKSIQRLKNAFGLSTNTRLKTQTSWINWYYYCLHSPVLRDLWNELRGPIEKEITWLLGYNPFEQSIELLARDYPLFNRILTLGLWLKYRIK